MCGCVDVWMLLRPHLPFGGVCKSDDWSQPFEIFTRPCFVFQDVTRLVTEAVSSCGPAWPGRKRGHVGQKMEQLEKNTKRGQRRKIWLWAYNIFFTWSFKRQFRTVFLAILTFNTIFCLYYIYPNSPAVEKDPPPGFRKVIKWMVLKYTAGHYLNNPWKQNQAIPKNDLAFLHLKSIFQNKLSPMWPH